MRAHSITQSPEYKLRVLAATSIARGECSVLAGRLALLQQREPVLSLAVNVYDARDGTAQSLLDHWPAGSRQPHLLSAVKGMRPAFWLAVLTPTATEQFSFVWLFDSDLDFGQVSLSCVARLLQAANVTIGQPLVGSLPGHRSTSHLALRSAREELATPMPSACLVQQVDAVETMTPFVRQAFWANVIHARVLAPLATWTDADLAHPGDIWLDRYWCALAQRYRVSDVPCAVVNATIMHIDKRTASGQAAVVQASSHSNYYRSGSAGQLKKLQSLPAIAQLPGWMHEQVGNNSKLQEMWSRRGECVLRRTPSEWNYSQMWSRSCARGPGPCPVGTGGGGTEALLRHLGVPPGTTYEDGRWPFVQRCNETRTKRSSVPDRWLDSPGAAATECILVPSQRLYVSLVWKAGTATLGRFFKCAFPDTTVHLLGQTEEQTKACSRAPRSWKHLATTRSPFERFLSAYNEFVERARNDTAAPWVSSTHNPASVPVFDRRRYTRHCRGHQCAVKRFVAFVQESACRTDRAWAHAATQSFFMRGRPVDLLLPTSKLSDALPHHFGHENCVPNSTAHLYAKENWLTQESFAGLLNQSSDLLRTLCKRYAQDLLCLGQPVQYAESEVWESPGVVKCLQTWRAIASAGP